VRAYRNSTWTLVLGVAMLAGCGAPPTPAPPVIAATTDSAGPLASATTTDPASTPQSTSPVGHSATPQLIHANLAARLTTIPASTTQVVIVHGGSYTTTYATLETYQRSGGVWRPVFAPMAARIGQRGFTDTPHEGAAATPTGVYSIGATFYGNSPNPGVHYAYHHLVQGDYWDENVSSPTYNTFVHGSDPGGASEALWQSPTAYSYFAFINYNVPAVPGEGSGIFLHQSLNRYTAGCVALPRDDLLRVLRWLDPAANPRIVMAPDSVLSRY
jgi:L,D-peptidoglycan transpeptidase YkuD (ErfK/YbiS/YcfS/YnhG family)